jgi:FtsP/CotA-like multicopper oxidase with cupredoxin domain
VNGQVIPDLSASPGERERWRVINACTSHYLRLRLDGQQVILLGVDSDRFEYTRDVDEVVLAPGNRPDLFVTARAGTSTLRALCYDRGASVGMMGGGATSAAEVALATFTVTDTDTEEFTAVPHQLAPRDLRFAVVTARREFVFALGMGGGMGDGMMSATINDRTFDAHHVDTTVQFGTVEEWALTNTSTFDHPLHRHV